MNGKVEQQGNEGAPLDTAKLLLSVIVLAAGVTGFYWFADSGHFALRVAGLVASLVLAGVIFIFTQTGRALTGFVSETRFELRKVTWPTRQETLQTTLVILVVVVIISIILWLIDMLLSWIVRSLVGM